MRGLVTGVVVASVTAACGSSSSGQPDVQAYSRLAEQISTTSASYATAASATTDVPGCQAGHAAYDGQVRPMANRMRSLSGDMDHEMETMGHAADADMTCAADAMFSELDHHDAVACTSATMSANHAEAGRHASAMEDWADHQRARGEELGGMMGMMGMSGGGPTTACRRNADGTFTLGR